MIRELANSATGPDTSQIDNNPLGQGRSPAQHADSGQCHLGLESEHHSIHQLSGLAVRPTL